MPSQLDSLPPWEVPVIDTATGQVEVAWRPWFSRLAQLVQGSSENGTTANRPTVDLYIGRPYFNTTLGKLEIWDGSAWQTWGDNGGGSFLPLAGGTMTGKIVLDGDPANVLHAAPKQYVDAFDDTRHGNRGGGALHADVVAAGADGFMTGADKTKIDGIESAATQDQTAAEILTALKTVDGSGSGLDADLLDNINSDSFLRSDTSDTAESGIFNFRTPDGTAIETGSSLNGLHVFQAVAGDDAIMVFHVSGDYAFRFGLDGGTNKLTIGGWSLGANKYQIWHEGNQGSGSGLDADKLDALEATDFIKKDGTVAMAANLAMGTNKITGVVDPTSNQEAATKKYVDDALPGGAAGKLVLIATASASNDSSIDFTGLGSTYDRLLLVGTDIIPATDGALASLRISIASAFKSGASDYAWGLGANFSTGSGNANSGSAAQIRIGQNTGSAAGESYAFHAWIPKVSGTTLYKNIYGMGCESRSNGSLGVYTFGGRYDTGTEAVDGIQFRFEAGNVSSGEFALYGLEKS